MSSESDTERRAASQLWNLRTPENPRLALLTTVSPESAPHATWMGTTRTDDDDIILTITSPDSKKVKNIRANPKVEWLITSHDRKELLYLEGKAEVVDDVAEIKRCWQEIPGKGKAFFLQYYNSGIGFAIIKTTVESAIYAVPEDCRKTKFAISELRE